MSIYAHMKTFFKRLWAGIKYTFEHRSRFGEWDEFIFRQEDIQKLRNYLNENFEQNEEKNSNGKT